ncbi:MAG: hypothetical protein H7239_01610 [Flavobacterium sp.]|nr:hypothetical protein [Flavobacterium sp.]
MKKIHFIAVIITLIIGCSSSQNSISNQKCEISTNASDTVRIANDSLEYEVIIIEPRFNYWLQSQAKPRGFYTENYLEGRNLLYVSDWNSRVLQPQRFNSKLYEMQINYNPSIHYGYEVNYLIYNYFIYFQLQYKQQLSGYVPRN